MSTDDPFAFGEPLKKENDWVWPEHRGMLEILTVGIAFSGVDEGGIDFSVPHGIGAMKRKLGPGQCKEVVAILQALVRAFNDSEPPNAVKEGLK